MKNYSEDSINSFYSDVIQKMTALKLMVDKDWLFKHRVLCFDETGLNGGATDTKGDPYVVTLKERLTEQKCRIVVKSRGYGDHVTLFYGHTYDGQTTQPGWILSGCESGVVSATVQERMNRAVSTHGTSDQLGCPNHHSYSKAIVRANVKGSVNSENFTGLVLEIVEDMYPDVSADEPKDNVVIFLDGHPTRLSDDFIPAMAARGIHIILWPPHTTSRYQCPDVAIFGELKPKMTQIKFRLAGHSCEDRYDLVEVCCEAIHAVSTCANIMAGLKVSGQVPFERNVHLDSQLCKDATTYCNKLTAGTLTDRYTFKYTYIHTHTCTFTDAYAFTYGYAYTYT
jgi:hypothetical protein